MPATIGYTPTNYSVTATTTAGRIVAASTASPKRAPRGVMVQSVAANTPKTYVGFSADVTAANGIELAAGQSIYFEYVDDPSKVWVISASATTDIRGFY